LIHVEKTSATVYRLEVTSSKPELVGKGGLLDPSGVTSISNVLYTPDSKACAYSAPRKLSGLFLVLGVRGSDHSLRSETVGSTRVARWAGM
jgi:hypothetical protein